MLRRGRYSHKTTRDWVCNLARFFVFISEEMQQAESKNGNSIVVLVIGIASIIITISDCILWGCLPYRIGPNHFLQFQWAGWLIPVCFCTAVPAIVLSFAYRRRFLFTLVLSSFVLFFVVVMSGGVHSGGDPRIWCYFNLRQIDAAKQELAGEHGLTNETPVTVEQISQYIDGGFANLKCYDGGSYVIEPVGTEPRCTVHGSVNEIDESETKQIDQ